MFFFAQFVNFWMQFCAKQILFARKRKKAAELNICMHNVESVWLCNGRSGKDGEFNEMRWEHFKARIIIMTSDFWLVDHFYIGAVIVWIRRNSANGNEVNEEALLLINQIFFPRALLIFSLEINQKVQKWSLNWIQSVFT